ncbi:hypothetical protein ACFLQ1_00515 [Candidatus Auribacterota bacterium]
MTKDEVVKHDLLCDVLFIVYSLFLISNNYFFLNQVSWIQEFCFIEVLGADQTVGIKYFNCFDLKNIFSGIYIEQFIYNTLVVFIDDKLLCFNLTPTLICNISIFLVYQIGSIKTNKLYGLAAAFIFSSIPVVTVYAKFNTNHTTETMWVLCAIYFYLKSNKFEKFIYNLFYAFSLLSLVKLGRSAFLYFLILLYSQQLFNNLWPLKIEKFIKKGPIIVTSVALIFKAGKEFLDYIGTHICDIYLYLPYQNRFSMHYVINFFSYVFYKLPLLLYNEYFLPIHFYLFFTFMFLDIFIKKQIKSENTIHFLFYIPLFIHLVCYSYTYLAGVFVIFAFFPIYLMRLLYLLKHFSEVNKKGNIGLINLILFSLKPVYRTAGFLFGLLLFVYGILLVTPHRDRYWLSIVANFFKIKQVIYISKFKEIDTDLHNMQSYIVNYIKLLIKDEYSRKIFLIYNISGKLNHLYDDDLYRSIPLALDLENYSKLILLKKFPKDANHLESYLNWTKAGIRSDYKWQNVDFIFITDDNLKELSKIINDFKSLKKYDLVVSKKFIFKIIDQSLYVSFVAVSRSLK